MAGETLEKLKQIGHDIKNSWYFRFWGLLWVVGVVITFAAFVVVVATDRHVNETWMEFSPTMTFPNFHFRVDRMSTQTFVNNIQCMFNGQMLAPQQCDRPEDSSMTQCQAIHPTQPAQMQRGDRFQRSINCTFQIQGTGPEGNIMAFELEGRNIFSQTDGGGDTSTWFGPNSMLWLVMKKKIFTWKSFEVDVWDTVPIYHSTIFTQQNYTVNVMIGEFLVMHITPKEMYSGWVVFGAIGGTGFFMTILCAIVMIFLGICFTNNSTFLNPNAANPSYSALK